MVNGSMNFNLLIGSIFVGQNRGTFSLSLILVLGGWKGHFGALRPFDGE